MITIVSILSPLITINHHSITINHHSITINAFLWHRCSPDRLIVPAKSSGEKIAPKSWGSRHQRLVGAQRCCALKLNDAVRLTQRKLWCVFLSNCMLIMIHMFYIDRFLYIYIYMCMCDGSAVSCLYCLDETSAARTDLRLEISNHGDPANG